MALLQVGFAMPSPSPMTRWALTPPFHPHRLETGSLFSVALSRGSPRVGVTHHPALWSPDFPRQLTAAAITRMARPIANSTDIPASPPQEGSQMDSPVRTRMRSHSSHRTTSSSPAASYLRRSAALVAMPHPSHTPCTSFAHPIPVRSRSSSYSLKRSVGMPPACDSSRRTCATRPLRTTHHTTKADPAQGGVGTEQV